MSGAADAGYVQAWQCIGCGRIEAPQPCIGVCRDRKVLLVGKEEHEAALAEIQQQRRAARAQRAQTQRSGFQMRIHRCSDTQQLPLTLQLREKTAQILDAHAGASCGGACHTPLAMQRLSAAHHGRRSSPCPASQAWSNSVSA